MNIEYYQEQLQAKEDMLARTTQYLLETQDRLIKKNDLVSGVNRSLFESIGFANLIQNALLPDPLLLKTHMQDGAYHVVNQIGIGGDSVFVKNSEHSTSFGLLDATGHGIPAAMLSISCVLIINELYAAPVKRQPREILKALSDRLYATFNRHRSIAHLEGTICQYVPAERRLYYSCAKGKGMFITAAGEVTDLCHTKQPIGEDNGAEYDLYSAECNPGDSVILFSDGLTDQFGGERNKKFSKRRLKEAIVDNLAMTASKLTEAIYDAHKEWKGVNEQTDDISFMVISF